MKGERFMVTLNPEQLKMLKALSKQTGASIAFLIRKAIDEKYLKRGKRK
jgi:predicted DNA-binding protein